MILYHASRREFKIGSNVEANSESNFYPEATEALDSIKPQDAPARKIALYSSDSAEFACCFLISQKLKKDLINLYEVEVKNPWKAAYSLTHIIQNRIRDKLVFDDLAVEYWSPSKDWKFYEYLSLSFLVTAKMELPNINKMIFLSNSGLDGDIANSIS